MENYNERIVKEDFSLSKVTGEFRYADVKAARFHCARLVECDLRHVCAEGVFFGGAEINETDARWAGLRRAEMPCTHINACDFTQADMRGVNLQGCILEGSVFYGANLEGANLRGARIRGSDLRTANLRGANLEGAELDCVGLEGAFLEGANLEGANLQVVRAWGARTINTKIEGATLDHVSSLWLDRKWTIGQPVLAL